MFLYFGHYHNFKIAEINFKVTASGTTQQYGTCAI